MFRSSRSHLRRDDATGIRRRRLGIHDRRQAPTPTPIPAPEDPEEEESEGENSDDEEDDEENPGSIGVGRHSPFNDLNQAPTLSAFDQTTITATSTSSSSTTVASTMTAPAGIIVGDNPGAPAAPTNTATVTVPRPVPSNQDQGSPLFIATTFITSSRDEPAPTSFPPNDLSTETPEEKSAPTSRSLQPGAKAGIAVGSIAAAALLISILLVLWKRCYIRRNRTSAVSSAPSGPPPPDSRNDSQILDDLMNQAYAHQNGGFPITDEKRETLDLANIPNAEIRGSIASWIRRHHPLKLNPMADKRSLRSTSSVGERSPTSMSSVPTTPRAPGWLNPPPSGRRLTPPRMAGKFISVWSDTTEGTTTTTTSAGEASILDMYGKTDTRATVMSDGVEFRMERASSPVLGGKI